MSNFNRNERATNLALGKTHHRMIDLTDGLMVYNSYSDAVEAARESYSDTIPPVMFSSQKLSIGGREWYSCIFIGSGTDRSEYGYSTIAILEEAASIYFNESKLSVK